MYTVFEWGKRGRSVQSQVDGYRDVSGGENLEYIVGYVAVSRKMNPIL